MTISFKILEKKTRGSFLLLLSLIQKWKANIIILIITLWLPLVCTAAGEPYSVRPSIETVEAVQHENLGKNWNRLKRAHLEAVAQLLEMHLDEEIYFLARDAELLHDLAKLETRGTDAEKRVHLLNVSRANRHDPHLRDYLSENGINEETLNLKRVLFVDTGFAGTISTYIESLFPDHENRFHTHLLCSSHQKFPSSRIFLISLNPVASTVDPSSMHGTIIHYENLPRFTARSDRYEQFDGLWQPISEQKSGGLSGKVSREKAMLYMQDLKYYAEENETKKLFIQRRQEWRQIREKIESQNKNELKNYFLKILNRHSVLQLEHFFDEAMVRDAIEIAERQDVGKRDYIPTIQDLGLNSALTGEYGNKLVLISHVPEWKKILEDPQNKILELIQKSDFQTIRNILDVIEDFDFMKVTYQVLASEYKKNSNKRTEIKKTILAVMGDEKNILAIRSYFFSFLKKSQQDDLDFNQALLYQLAFSENEETQRIAAEILRNIKPKNPEIQDRIAKILGVCTSPKICRTLIDILGLIRPRSLLTRLALLKRVSDQNSTVRISAITALGKIKCHDILIQKELIHRLSDKNRAVRLIAADVLGCLHPIYSKGLKTIVKLLGSENIHLRSVAALALGNIESKDPTIHQALLSRFLDKQEDVRVRCNAVAALGRVNRFDPNISQILVRGLEDESLSVRSSVATALKEIEPQDSKIYESLIRGLSNPNLFIRCDIVNVLGKIRAQDENVQVALVKALRDSNDFVCSEAAFALGAAKSQDIHALEGLVQLLLKVEGYASDSAAGALIKIQPKNSSIIESIISNLGNPNIIVRRRIFRVLSYLDLSSVSISFKSILGYIDNGEIEINDFINNRITWSFSGKKFSDDEFIHFFKGNGLFSKIKKLDLSSAVYDSRLLLDLPASLVQLNLSQNQLNQEDVARLFHLVNLTSLDLGWNKIGNEGVSYLVPFKYLTSLDLSNNEIGSLGICSVSQLKNLVFLDLSFNAIGSEDAVSVVQNLAHLTSLNLSSNWIDQSIENQLRQQLPLCKIQF